MNYNTPILPIYIFIKLFFIAYRNKNVNTNVVENTKNKYM